MQAGLPDAEWALPWVSVFTQRCLALSHSRSSEAQTRWYLQSIRLYLPEKTVSIVAQGDSGGQVRHGRAPLRPMSC